MPTVEHNLPAEHTPPIGREGELEAVRVFLLDSTTPLVTLIGPGGIGKTTLALHLAHDIVEQFRDGVHFVDLTPLTQPDLIPDQIARAVGLDVSPDRDARDALIAYYTGKRALLVLDNFEHVLPGAATLSALLHACPSIRMLTTSREALRLREEQVYPVPPLSLPKNGQATDPATLIHNPAVALFVERARAVRPGFVLTTDNSAAVAGIVARLDGLPLAIELAAARVRLFPPKVLLERLNVSLLGTLVGGARDAPERQQTIRATVAWSYALLTPEEQRLFRLLGAFADGFTLEAVEAVARETANRARAGDPETDTLDELESLLDKNLIVRLPVEDDLRFGLLTTLRDFAREQLAAELELGAVQRAHFVYYLDLAEQSAAAHRSFEQGAWLARIATAEDNLRLALAWSLDQAADDSAQAGDAVQLAGALGRYWQYRSHPVEARRWLERALVYCSPAPADVTPENRARVAAEARVFSGAGTLAYSIGDFAAAATHHRDALAGYQALGDERRVAETLVNLSSQYSRMTDNEQAIAVLEEALAISLRIEDWWGAARAYNNLGVIEEDFGHNETALPYYNESLIMARRAGDDIMQAIALHNLGLLAMRADRLEEAEDMLEASLTAARAADFGHLISSCRLIQGEIARRRGDRGGAWRAYQELLRLALDREYRYYFATGLHALAVLALDAEQAKTAAMLAGVVSEFRRQFDIRQLDTYSPRGFEGDLAAIRAALSDPAYEAAWNAGRRLSRDEVIALAMVEPTIDNRPQTADSSQTVVRGPSSVDRLAELTPREREVALLMAAGRTNEEIAAELFITIKTVEKHAGNVLGKLGFHSRVELAAWAAANGYLT